MKKYLPHYFEFHSGRLADDLHNRCLSHLRKEKKHESLLVIYDLGNSLMFYGVVVCLFERDYFFSLHMEGRDIIVLKTREQREKWVTHLDHYKSDLLLWSICLQRSTSLSRRWGSRQVSLLLLFIAEGSQHHVEPIINKCVYVSLENLFFNVQDSQSNQKMNKK